MTSAEGPQLAIIIPTRDRRAVLLETLTRLSETADAAPIELVVVDDGSDDETATALAGIAPTLPWRAQILRQDATGPATARNRGMRAASAPVCLLIGDDTWATPAMVQRHLDFHLRNPEPAEALLGRVVPAAPLGSSPFIRWLHERGTQFGYAYLDPDRQVGAECFWTSNISLKRDFALDAGGFDEGFPGAACEDAELGLRLGRRGMRLRYDPEAVGEHYHPTDLERTLLRMEKVGIAYRRLCELAPEMRRPPIPGARHRIKAAGLTALMSAPVRPRRVREGAWRFLCDEVQREAYWGVDGRPPGLPAIGGRLARIALADPLSRPLEGLEPLPV